jgi:GNAT superfamily N-acetyltransferase
MDIHIRKANVKDADMLMEMWKEFTQVHDEIVIRKNSRIKPHIDLDKNAYNTFKRFIKKQIISKYALVSIAEVDGKPAGYTLSFIKKNIPVYAVERLGYIVDMYVKKEYCGLGISSKLKDEVIEWCKKEGVKYIALTVFYDNEHARKVYEKWGFFNHSIEMRKEI